MSQRFIKEFKRLCHCLLYVTALRVKKSVLQRSLKAQRLSGCEVTANTELETPSASSKTIFAKVFGSLPLKVEHISTVSGIEVFIYKFREEVLDFCTRDRDEIKARASFFGRSTGFTRSPGLENLKVTLNLARGDLEESLAF